jgi:hypothetical protein
MKKDRQSAVFFRASGGFSWAGGYCVFLVAIEGFVYQVVELNHQSIQIMSGKCDQMRPKFYQCKPVHNFVVHKVVE